MIRNIMLRSVYYCRGEDVFNTINFYKILENDGVDAIASYKIESMAKLLKYVSDNIPYYHKLNSSLNRTATLCDYPVISKNEIKNNLQEFLPPNIRYSWRSTSGSTGSPFVFPKDRYATTHMDAVMHHLYSWYGINIGDRQARLWGTNLNFIGNISQKVKDYLLNRKRLSVFLMNEDANKRFYNELIKFQPKFIYAYTNSLYQFALSIERQGLEGKRLGIPVAICTGEVLFPFQREKIESIMGCIVVNEYGSSENGIIAFECMEKKMHLVPNLEVEILNADVNGYGNVVITELNSKAIPFVRYSNGDIAKLSNSKCNCNKPYSVINLKEGRIHDYVRCIDGNTVHAAIFAYSLKEVAIKFRVVQESIDTINILIIPNTKFCVNSEIKIISGLKEYLGDKMNISFSIVKEIPPENSGKLRYFESKIGNIP